MKRTHSGKGIWLVPLALLAGLCAWAGATEKLNYWEKKGDTLIYTSADLTMEAALPHGWRSLKVKGSEFLASGEGYGGVAFRRPDGSFVTTFTDLSNISHDALQGRNGSVADGLFLAKVITGWSLPTFEFYAGFNDPADHDLVLFLHDDVLAVRLGHKGQAISSARTVLTPDDKPGALRPGDAAFIVHRSGMVLRIHHKLQAGVIKTPDGRNRLAVVIPCKGMTANTIEFQYDTHNAEDARTVFPRLSVDSPAIARQKHYRPQSHGYWALYEKDEPVTYTISFGWLGSEPFAGKAVLEARHALGQDHFRIEAKAEAVPGQKGQTVYRCVLRPKFRLPGVSEVHAHLLGGDGTVLYTQRGRILYDWPSYKPTYNAQPDQDAFWDATLAELAKVPLEPRVEEQLFKGDPKWEFYHISFNGWRKQRIHACLYVPKGAKTPLPVMVASHPGTRGFGVNHDPDGVYGSKVKQDPRFVTIVPLIRGHEPDAKDIPFNQPWWGPLDSRDDYVARGWYCAMVRALDYLATRPDLADMSRVVARGGSQGGALALVTAALDRRVKVCIADSPSNCMHHDAVRPDTYQTFGPSAGQVPKGQTLDDLLRTLSYYDPAHLATRITCPTVIHLTVGDLTVHAMGGLGVYKNLTELPEGRKWFCPGVNGHFHAGSAAGGEKARELIDALLAE